MWISRALMLLALIVWIGGIVFFAFVMAPILFVVLPSPQLAGNVVSPALARLHWIGLAAGVVFLFSSISYNWSKHLQLRLFAAPHIFLALMLLLTAISQFGITPRMRDLRAGRSSAPDAAAEFDRLHEWSTRCEGGVLVLGLAVVVLTARRFGAGD